MARTISVTKSEVTLNHGSVPFAPPANVVIKNYTTINLNYTFTYSGLGSGKKLFSSNIDAYSNAPLRPGKEFEWGETINYWSNTSTVASGSKSFNLSYVPDPSGNPEYPEFDELLPGDEFAINAHMAIYDVVNYDWAIEDSHISTFEYAEWEPPQIVSYTAYRANSSGTPDDAGTKIRYSMNASVLPLTGYGHGEFFIRYKRPADVSWTEVSLGNNITSINVSNAELSGNFPLNESYIIQFVAYDGYVSAVAQTQIYTGTTCMHFNAQKDGIGIGKYSEGPGFDVGWDARFRGEVQFDQAPSYLTPVAAREALGIYTGRSVFTGVGSGTQYITVPFGKTLPSVPSAVIASIGVSGSMTSTYQTVDTTYAYTDHDFRIKCNNGSSLNTVWVDWIAIL